MTKDFTIIRELETENYSELPEVKAIWDGFQMSSFVKNSKPKRAFLVEDENGNERVFKLHVTPEGLQILNDETVYSSMDSYPFSKAAIFSHKIIIGKPQFSRSNEARAWYAANNWIVTRVS